jgi:hypothetical protein
MSSVRAWQRLSEAIESILAVAGCSREEAQTDICHAIADRTVRIQGKLRIHTTRHITSNRVLEGKDFLIPDEIKPADLDWEDSRPLTPWAVERDVFRLPGSWELEWIKLFSTDVTNILCGGPTERTSNRTSATTRRRPARERAQQAINELYHNGVPDPATLPNALLCRRIGEKLKKLGLPQISDDTILRVAGRRRK